MDGDQVVSSDLSLPFEERCWWGRLPKGEFWEQEQLLGGGSR